MNKDEQLIWEVYNESPIDLYIANAYGVNYTGQQLYQYLYNRIENIDDFRKLLAKIWNISRDVAAYMKAVNKIHNSPY